ncbi:MAG: hypothetical protein E6Q40_02015 [Cupriavidus sp.]|nr:MAG: hypothetical protein E6Q40_02015 [Cupriavidus sp.]
MREDQKLRLQDLAERLADVFISEADPDNWSGSGKLPNEMTKQERGDRHWDRKGAMGTGGVLKYTLDLIAGGKAGRINDADEQAARDADLDARISNAEKRARQAAARVLDKAAKGEYDARAQGKR